MIWHSILLLACAVPPAYADKYEDWARDFIVIRQKTETCIDAAST